MRGNDNSNSSNNNHNDNNPRHHTWGEYQRQPQTHRQFQNYSTIFNQNQSQQQHRNAEGVLDSLRSSWDAPSSESASGNSSVLDNYNTNNTFSTTRGNGGMNANASSFVPSFGGDENSAFFRVDNKGPPSWSSSSQTLHVTRSADIYLQQQQRQRLQLNHNHNQNQNHNQSQSKNIYRNQHQHPYANQHQDRSRYHQRSHNQRLPQEQYYQQNQLTYQHQNRNQYPHQRNEDLHQQSGGLSSSSQTSSRNENNHGYSSSSIYGHSQNYSHSHASHSHANHSQNHSQNNSHSHASATGRHPYNSSSPDVMGIVSFALNGSSSALDHTSTPSANNITSNKSHYQKKSIVIPNFSGNHLVDDDDGYFNDSRSPINEYGRSSSSSSSSRNKASVRNADTSINNNANIYNNSNRNNHIIPNDKNSLKAYESRQSSSTAAAAAVTEEIGHRYSVNHILRIRSESIVSSNSASDLIDINNIKNSNSTSNRSRVGDSNNWKSLEEMDQQYMTSMKRFSDASSSSTLSSLSGISDRNEMMPPPKIVNIEEETSKRNMINTNAPPTSPAASSRVLPHSQGYSKLINDSVNRSGAGTLIDPNVKKKKVIVVTDKDSQTKALEEEREVNERLKGIVTQSSYQNSTTTNRDPSNATLTIPNSVDSAINRAAYKEFIKAFRLKEKVSVEDAQFFAEMTLLKAPESIHWKINLDLGDLAKRSNDFERARSLYKYVLELNPQATQAWLEWSKMEEDCGHFEISLNILRRGLSECNFNEGLLTKAVKQLERLQDVPGARRMLGRTAPKFESIERAWKSILEGALLESRAGRMDTARQFLNYLMACVSWYGPIYFEAFKIEEKVGDYRRAMQIVKRGLKELPRYGPLWFGRLRLLEREDNVEERTAWFNGQEPVLSRLGYGVKEASEKISRELVWKVYFEHAQAVERAVDVAADGLRRVRGLNLVEARNELLGGARKAYIKSLLACPPNLRWKVWLSASRMEISAGRVPEARQIICWAFSEVPEKSKSHVYLEASRIEEFMGNIDGAIRIIKHGQQNVRGDWKVFLEAVLLKARAGRVTDAIDSAELGLQLHSGTGRLWAILVQLHHRSSWLGYSSRLNTDKSDVIGNSDVRSVNSSFSSNTKPNWNESFSPSRARQSTLMRALREVPKSGEVWCEGARSHMNPLDAVLFDPALALRYLTFAIQFTPQYGDTFIEYMRVEIINQLIFKRLFELLGLPTEAFSKAITGDSTESDTAVLSSAAMKNKSISRNKMSSSKRVQHITEIECLEFTPDRIKDTDVVVDALMRRCSNADSNYGILWFFCRKCSTDSSKTVLESARSAILYDLVASSPLYMRAASIYLRRTLKDAIKRGFETSNSGQSDSDATGISGADLNLLKPYAGLVNEVLKDYAKSDNVIGQNITRWKSLPLATCRGNVFTSADFSTALVEVNRRIFDRNLDDEERRKALFQSDQIIP